jgi:cell fate regulator YaaT (PSP1 superfamily)
MACQSCSTSDGGAPKGCKNNGTCGTDSCNKLTVFDWLANMSLPNGETAFDCVEVRFKNGRKEFFRNTEKLTLGIGDVVATEASPGHDVGIITLTGELVKIQMKKKGVNHTSPDIQKVYRKASQKDIDIWSEARDKEAAMQVKARELAIIHKLEMKISDVEFQGDGSKVIFYYTANDRVDFRLLIKDYSRVFNTRIEMKQVGLRQEAARLGGIGSCGRELCCSTWLTDFRSVNTSAARYQQLSLNPQKLAGQCGKLKCCLNYELDTYLDALKGFPDFETKLKTEKGDAICQKQDIFKGLMWFAYTDNFANWHVLNIEQVKEIMAENKQNKKVSSLEDFAIETVAEPEKDFNNAMGQESLTRFDQPKKSKNKNRNKNKSKVSSPLESQSNRPQSNQNSNEPKVNKIQSSETKQNGPKPLESKQNRTQTHQQKANGGKLNQNQKREQGQAQKQNQNRATGERSETKPADKKPIIIKKNENKE